jgi:rhamnosyltransferase
MTTKFSQSDPRIRPYAVVVTYSPQLSQTLPLLEALEQQQAHTIVVDNGSPETIVSPLIQKSPLGTLWLRNASNEGIAAAQNRGIREAMSRGATHVILFDQDSRPAPDMLARLLSAEATLLAAGASVAAVGPQLIDETTGERAPFITFINGRKHRMVTSSQNQHVRCFSLLASGTLIRTEILEQIGLMKDELFIEYVDVEWGARAHAAGLHCYGIGEAQLYHNLGDDRIQVLPNFFVPLHKPVRHYYTMRNAVYMQKQPYVPAYWKRSDLFRTMAGFIIFSLFNPPRLMQIRMMLKGFAHGFAGRYGPL